MEMYVTLVVNDAYGYDDDNYHDGAVMMIVYNFIICLDDRHSKEEDGAAICNYSCSNHDFQSNGRC